MSADEVERALTEVRQRIEAAAARAYRSAEEVRLVAVSKGVVPERIAHAITHGVLDIGENRVQELQDKQQRLRDRSEVRWHFVGTLQRNKVRHVAGEVALIHSVDSAGLAAHIAKSAASKGMSQGLLLQVNASGERSKHGVRPQDVQAEAEAIATMTGVRLLGLMTIAEAGGPNVARASFRVLREIRDRSAIPGMVELSMGMSSDYEAAVEEGATIVRIGSAIFGPRP
jgi:PLP dependent protein